MELEENDSTNFLDLTKSRNNNNFLIRPVTAICLITIFLCSWWYRSIDALILLGLSQVTFASFMHSIVIN